MSIIDRYTILKYTEKWRELSGAVLDRLYNSSIRARVISLGLVFLVLAGSWQAVRLCRDEPAVSAAHKLVLTGTDAGGDRWMIDFVRSQNAEALINGPVKPGLPLTLTFELARKQSELLIQPELTGAAGELYYCGIVKNGQWQEPPMVVISDQAGKPLVKGRLKYG